ncbi:MAG: hypothetical protein IPP17_14845 [Bacteroidetes bacterium]|nr:hypothetical protein [Bacteroidota bacterium]
MTNSRLRHGVAQGIESCRKFTPAQDPAAVNGIGEGIHMELIPKPGPQDPFIVRPVGQTDVFFLRASS